MNSSISDQGFILHSVRFGEGDKFLKVLTINNGLIDLISKGSSRPNSRKSPHIDLLNRIKFQTSRGGPPRYLSQVESRQVFSHIKSSLPLARATFYICELLIHILPNNEVDYTIFNLVSQFLNSLEDGAELRSTCVKLQLDIINHLGFPKPHDETPQGLIDYFEKLLDRSLKSKDFKIG